MANEKNNVKMTIDESINFVIDNCGQTMFVKCGGTDILCTIVGYGVLKNQIKNIDELFILAYKQNHNGIDFPKESMEHFKIIHSIEDAKIEQFIKIPFDCCKIFKNKIISCFS